MPSKKTVAIKSALKNKKIVLILTLALIGGVIFLSGLFAAPQNTQNSIVTADIGGQTFSLEVLDTNASRIQGLSGRDSLASDEGVLFDFKKSDDWRIWMKDMNFSIDIAWLSADKEIIYIKSNAKPEDYPETYFANAPSLYVIEVPVNTFDNLGVNVGDTVGF